MFSKLKKSIVGGLAGIVLACGMPDQTTNNSNNNYVPPVRDSPTVQIEDIKTKGNSLPTYGSCAVPDKNRDIAELLNYDTFSEVKAQLQEIGVLGEYECTGDESGLLIELLQEYDGFAPLEEKKQLIDSLDSNLSLSEKYFVTKITHSLWLEKQRITPWSLADYSKQEIDLLFGKVELGEKPKVEGLEDHEYDISSAQLNLRTEAAYQMFPFASVLIKEDAKTTKEEVLRWTKRNFRHADHQVGWDVYADGRTGSSQYNPLSLERLFDERVAGCHLAGSTVHAHLLKTLNIPAAAITLNGHGVIYTADGEFVHGDNITDFVVVPTRDYAFGVAEAKRLAMESNYSDRLRDMHPELSRVGLTRTGSDLYVQGQMSEPSAIAKLPDMQAELGTQYLLEHRGSGVVISNRVLIKKLEEL